MATMERLQKVLIAVIVALLLGFVWFLHERYDVVPELDALVTDEVGSQLKSGGVFDVARVERRVRAALTLCEANWRCLMPRRNVDWSGPMPDEVWTSSKKAIFRFIRDSQIALDKAIIAAAASPASQPDLQQAIARTSAVFNSVLPVAAAQPGRFCNLEVAEYAARCLSELSAPHNLEYLVLNTDARGALKGLGAAAGVAKRSSQQKTA